MTEAERTFIGKMNADAEAYRRRHAGARPANLELPPIGSFAEDFPKAHRLNGEQGKRKD